MVYKNLNDWSLAESPHLKYGVHPTSNVTQFALGVQKLDPDAILPTKAHDGDLGYDLYTTEEYIIPGMTRMLLQTGIACRFPDGFGGIIRDRSSVASKMGCFVKAGTIDNGYRGEIFVLIFNSTTLPVTVKKGAKIAQMILTPVYTVEVVEVEELDETSRGTGGFGSTGA